jgi:hypothetical protein
MRHVAELHSCSLEGGNRKKSGRCMRLCPARTLSRAEIRRRGWSRSPKLLLISAICEDNLPLSFPRLVRSEEKERKKEIIRSTSL